MTLCAIGAFATSVTAHQTQGDPFPHTHNGEKRVVRGEIYTPTIWVDPDGCEHWVMDDGWEGFMTPKLNRNGMPTCRGSVATSNVCGVMSSDTLFATNSYHLSHSAQRHLMNFFSQNRANAYSIVGHTDSRASHAYNDRLSVNRARSVANFAQRNGVRIAQVSGRGERQPIATNGTRHGMAKNRRVEIICVN
ncbi:MAG: OmpA family protein [Planktomarina sp.]